MHSEVRISYRTLLLHQGSTPLQTAQRDACSTTNSNANPLSPAAAMPPQRTTFSTSQVFDNLSVFHLALCGAVLIVMDGLRRQC